MSITSEKFGMTADGKEVSLFTIVNKSGMTAKVTNYGAILISLLVPDEHGNFADVVLGYDTLEDYKKNDSFFGATIGRSANRVANAKFTIDGVEYCLDVNDGPNNLHTDFEKGFHKQVWKATEIGERNELILSYVSPDGENGIPGTLDIRVSYTLTDDNALEIHYFGVSDKKTLINCTNHSYFNFKGAGNGDICNHRLRLAASHYTPIVKGAIPTGEIADVKGTPMDFTNIKRIGDEIDNDFEQLKMTGGYDHNWVVDKASGMMGMIAEVIDDESGRHMEVYSDLPGVQFYAGNGISDTIGKNGCPYTKRSGFCLETQYYPNSINQEGFPSPIFDAGHEYNTTTIYRFI